MKLNYIKCHGSGNEFVLFDAVATDMSGVELSALSKAVCCRSTGIGADGILLLVRNNEGLYGMRMLNPDGSEAEMCGNGIRCVARLAQHYTKTEQFNLTSRGKIYPTAHCSPIFEDIPTYGVEIGVRLWSDDFAMEQSENGDFIDRVIEPLHPTLRWTAISVGNPHIVARVDKCDLSLLEQLGERVKSLTELFPHGVNVSLYECRSRRSIFVATYERGAGITLSCGTAMTASATAAALLNKVDAGERIEVRNRGGKVFCTTRNIESPITRLEGNATYNWLGEATFMENTLNYAITTHTHEEELWQQLVQSIE
jgi:diaminopimelate epimerase